MSDVWNNVTVYGPASEIERFKRLCIAPAESVYRAGQSGWDGCECTISVPAVSQNTADADPSDSWFEYVWNFQQFTTDSSVEYSFSFDRYCEFPVELFERLASRFPKLAFDCDCIEALDEFMGFGWFNPPPGGERFRQDYAVPANFWTGGGGFKRSPAASAEHAKRVARLEETARTGS